MKIAKTIKEIRAIRAEMTGIVGLVPTMGALHNGHLSLVAEAKNRCDSVIVTIFVNPTQFAPQEDLDSYPRTLETDLQYLKAYDVDAVFIPTSDVIYPEGYATYVEVEILTERLEGSQRAGHFRGVATIVTKLFNIVQAQIAFFGQKDAQQVIVIRRMVFDLNIPIEIIPVPTVREADGLAMSSRNQYLTPDQRAIAVALYQGLQAASQNYEIGERDPANLRNSVQQVLVDYGLEELDYISIVDPQTLEEQTSLLIVDAPVLILLAVRVGKPRLLDNMLLPAWLNTVEGLTKYLGIS